jgi:porin
LQFNGQPTNEQAGSVQGYNSLPGPKPLHRSELYQLWWRQEFFDSKLILRIGKLVPTDDFNNVLRPVPVQDQHLAVPAVSGLLYTPVFINPTLLGSMPGYYNSADGITTTFALTKNIYLCYGIYDGNIARGVQTGLTGPHFNGYYLIATDAK